MDDNCIIYRNRQVYGREYDVCILIPEKGVLVVELKGWKEENILRIDNNESVIINTDDGEIPSSPQKQARGYRFSMERFIKQNIGKFPLVFQMVCLPQVSQAFFKSLRLDIVMEEKFTILKEDLKNKTAFYSKLNEALREVTNWKRDSFDSRTLLEIRNLFETNIDLNGKQDYSLKGALSITEYHNYDYSRFYYLDSDGTFNATELKDIIDQYLRGCKLYCVFSKSTQLQQIVDAMDSALSQRGLVRNSGNIELSFDNEAEHAPIFKPGSVAFMGFHCSMSVLDAPLPSKIVSFSIRNGEYSKYQKQQLIDIANVSQFNAEQYFVEHAAPDKNIVIRAGAGTGKTYTMISRIGFICYTQQVSLQKMADRIVMITFTNEAAAQMKDKLKTYYRNCYLITSRVEYLNMISWIDHMQISTIHSYAKRLIEQLGTSFGYGIDVSVTSSEYYRKRIISDILDTYILKKKIEYGKSYSDRLGMPVYAIRDSILDFIKILHNKSVDITAIESSDFGSLALDESHSELHELFATVIPAVECAYSDELLKNDRIHLSSMMSTLSKLVSTPEGINKIREMKNDEGVIQFMFVDEFQDTDDIQIETLLTLAKLLGYKLFLVGDIKQCIYRFRGAKEKAFDQLNVESDSKSWLEFSLQRNYRTDISLLKLFDISFSNWGARDDELLTYNVDKDRLIGTKDYNGYLLSQPNRFYRKISVSSNEMRVPALVEEIKRLQKRIEYDENHGQTLAPNERCIAILVRENWQAEMVRTECGKLGISVHTNTGGDLYMSQPALDMMTLVNALVHFDEAEYLYNLVTSNFFNIDVPKSNLIKIRLKMRANGWRSKADEREQVNYLISLMNAMLVNSMDKDNKWEYIVASLRIKPVLQTIRKIYSTLKPWNNFSSDPWKRHYYQLNVDLLFEELVNACNVDRLTISTLQEHLYNCIVSHTSVDSRVPTLSQSEVPIQCITVHKSKGLEYGHVILPFCSNPINRIKKSKLHVSATKVGERYHIGYSLNISESGETVQNDFYDEKSEKEEKSREETRILYVAMTRAIRSFSWIEIEGEQDLSWQNLIQMGD